MANLPRLAGRLTWTEPLVAVVLRAAVVLAVTLEPRRDATQVVAQEEPRVAAVVHRCPTESVVQRWLQLAYMYNTGRLRLQLTSPQVVGGETWRKLTTEVLVRVVEAVGPAVTLPRVRDALLAVGALEVFWWTREV